jgi:hypothetical protein
MHHQRLKGILLFLIVSLSLSAQNAWYVGNSGTNAAGFGTTPATPYKTITYATGSLTPGDTLYILGGTYYNANYRNGDVWKIEQTARINNLNGAAGQYIVIKPYANQPVKLKGDGDFIMQIRNSSYIKVEGFEFEGLVDSISLTDAFAFQFAYKNLSDLSTVQYRVPAGTTPEVIETMTFTPISNTIRPSYYNTIGLLSQNSHHIDLINNYVHHCPGTGLRVFQGDYINCIGNEVSYNSGRSAVGNHGLVFHSAKSVDTVSSAKILITNNHVHHNYNEVFSWSELKTFITPHLDEGKGISMQKNTVENGWHCGRILIANNITHHNGFSGVHVNEGIRFDFINNTSYHDHWTNPENNNIGMSVAGGDSIRIYNNVVVLGPEATGFAYSIAQATNITADKNHYIGGVIDPDFTAIDNNTTAGPVFFVDTIQFKLQATSPLINNALTAFAPAKDYYNVTRDAQPDLGAVEYVAPIIVTPPTPCATPTCVKPDITLVPSITGTSVSYQWTAGCHTKYRLQYRKVGSTTWSFAYYPANATQGTVTMPQSGTYQWSLRGACSNGLWSPTAVGTNYLVP